MIGVLGQILHLKAILDQGQPGWEYWDDQEELYVAWFDLWYAD